MQSSDNNSPIKKCCNNMSSVVREEEGIPFNPESSEEEEFDPAVATLPPVGVPSPVRVRV
jgi:hypothetical protein